MLVRSESHGTPVTQEHCRSRSRRSAKIAFYRGKGDEAKGMNWRLWFVQLSGWPVFLAIVALVSVFAVGLSIVLPHIAGRSAFWPHWPC